MAYVTIPIRSTAIAYLAYDEDTEDAQLTFHDGGSYLLTGVPAIEIERLVAAASPGAYWNSYMKGNY